MANFFKPTKKNQNAQQQLVIKIDKLDHNGVGVGRHQGKPVFVATSLPGEVVEAKVIENKSKYIRAQLKNVSQSSVDRTEPVCRHFYQCGGCDFQHLAYEKQLQVKQEKVVELFGRHGFNGQLPWLAPIVSSPYHYRRKVRIGVQYDKKGDAIIGFRKRATNQLVNITNCAIVEAPYQDVFVTLKQVLAKLSLYKSVGHIELIVTERLTVVVRQLQTITNKDKKVWQQFAEQHQWQVYLDDGEQLVALTDIKPLTYSLADGSEITFGAHDFIQVNNLVNQQMIDTALQWLSLKGTDIVLDLFCGLGNFSLPIAKKVHHVVGVEGVQAMVERSTANANNNQLDNCQFFQADLNADWLDNDWAKLAFTHIVLDPARAGAYQALEQIVQLKVNTLLYVSCDPQTLARDCELLVSQGYKLKKIMLMDMFSQTKHIETMVLFTRDS
ncbi:23S rRNA (uracil(1939)-C(5))-methyltransferase RlmD [Thalassotalea sp. PLHSN55]|uniref:23S rRNA (uracil(1939)-C(5))-methyltransferase RlmD n=1 Tax=Thalassotalea sp. PLHSN55 TaxID=3435888 RepID=UPI003F87238B